MFRIGQVINKSQSYGWIHQIKLEHVENIYDWLVKQIMTQRGNRACLLNYSKQSVICSVFIGMHSEILNTSVEVNSTIKREIYSLLIFTCYSELCCSSFENLKEFHMTFKKDVSINMTVKHILYCSIKHVKVQASYQAEKPEHTYSTAASSVQF